MADQQPEFPTWTYQGHQVTSSNFVTTLIHLYRAEVSRANVWRNRLDTTTNWAVATVGASLTFAFSSPLNPHFVLLLVLLLMLTFLYIEARRYRYYAMWYRRVNLLETDFIAAMLLPPHQPSPDWGASLHEALATPTFPISNWQAVGHRYRRNYIWLVTLLLCSWVLKLLIHPFPAETFQEFVERAQIEPAISGGLTLGGVVLIYSALFLLAMITRIPWGREESPKRSPWKILPQKRSSPENLAIIITSNKEVVAERLLHELKRGVTALKGVGMYTHEERDVLLCALTEVQIPQLKKVLQEADPGAFLVINRSIQVHGGGFPGSEPPS